MQFKQTTRKRNPRVTSFVQHVLEHFIKPRSHLPNANKYCTKYRSVFSLSPQELGKYTLAKKTFPLEPGTRPVNRTLHSANTRVQETIDKCVNQMEQDGMIEHHHSPWGSAVTIVAKSDGTPRFCVDYRSTKNSNPMKTIVAYS